VGSGAYAWTLLTYNACPKDSYLLPNIDALVVNGLGCGLLNLMDAYSSYNEI